MRSPATAVLYDDEDDANPIDSRRELARRVSGGVEVTLYWNSDDNSTSIEIWQQDSELTLQFPVLPECALDAFYHPFAQLDSALGEAPHAA